MKHLKIDKYIDSCAECAYLRSSINSNDEKEWCCYHPKFTPEIRFVALDKDIMAIQIPFWCPLSNGEV